MRSKNKRKSNSSFNNVSTSCAILNNHVDNNIDFNMVEPIEEKKRYVIILVYYFSKQYGSILGLTYIITFKNRYFIHR